MNLVGALVWVGLHLDQISDRESALSDLRVNAIDPTVRSLAPEHVSLGVSLAVWLGGGYPSGEGDRCGGRNHEVSLSGNLRLVDKNIVRHFMQET